MGETEYPVRCGVCGYGARYIVRGVCLNCGYIAGDEWSFGFEAGAL